MSDINDDTVWFEVAASNNAAPPNGWPEGMAPNQVNDTAREGMGALKRFYDHINATATSGGTANAQTLTYDLAPTALVTGDRFYFKVGTSLSNTAAATLNINGIGAKAVQVSGRALTGYEMQAGQFVELVYDGTQFQLNNTPGASLNALIPFAADGGSSQVWSTNSLWEITQSATHTHQYSTFAILRHTTGSGTNGPSHSDNALVLGVNKVAYLDPATVDPGEVDALYIYSEQGSHGDSSGILGQVYRVDDGVTSNYGSSFAEGLTATVAPTTGAFQVSLFTSLGQVISTPSTGDIFSSTGLRAEASTGANGVGLLIDSLDQSDPPLSNVPSWSRAAIGRRNRSNSIAHVYWDMTQLGQMIIRGLDVSASELTLDSNSFTSNNAIIFAHGGNLKYYTGLFSDDSYQIFDFVLGASPFNSLAGVVTVGITGKSLTLVPATLKTALNSTTTYANDAAAASGGVSVGQLYRNGSVVQVRVT